MAMINSASNDPAGAAIILRVVNVFESAFVAFSTWRARRMTERQLSSLTDKQLHDIGVFRGDIEEIAKQRY